jgi:hypothetical protein
MDPILRVSSAPEPDAERVIGDGLSAFNDATVGYADRVPLHVLVSDQTVETSSAGLLAERRSG